MVGMDKTESIQRTPLRIRTGELPLLWQIGSQEGQAFLEMTLQLEGERIRLPWFNAYFERSQDANLLYDTERGGGSELGPVGSLREPLEVVPQEEVVRGTTVHEAMAYQNGRIYDTTL